MKRHMVVRRAREQRLREALRRFNRLLLDSPCPFCRGWWSATMVTTVDYFLDGRDDFDDRAEPDRDDAHKEGCAYFQGRTAAPGDACTGSSS